MGKIKSYLSFLNEGKREEKKIDELLDIISKRDLTPDEKDLLTRLSNGETLPEEKPVLKTHKTGGGFEFDEDGNVMVEGEDDEIDPNEEFITDKGKKKSVDKIDLDLLDARVYRHKDREERFFFVYINNTEDNKWIVYRTGSNDKNPYGQLMDNKNPNYLNIKNRTPKQMWDDLDQSFDYFMVLDNDLYKDFLRMIELYKNKKNNTILKQLRDRFSTLI